MISVGHITSSPVLYHFSLDIRHKKLYLKSAFNFKKSSLYPLECRDSILWNSIQAAVLLNLNLNSLPVKRQIDNPSPGAVTGGN